jgi:hypothetical protein
MSPLVSKSRNVFVTDAHDSKQLHSLAPVPTLLCNRLTAWLEEAHLVVPKQCTACCAFYELVATSHQWQWCLRICPHHKEIRVPLFLQMSWQSRSERVQHIFWRANPALSLGARGHTRLKGNLDEIPETTKIVSGKCAHKSLAVLSTFIMSSL